MTLAAVAQEKNIKIAVAKTNNMIKILNNILL